jgi:hypothetical protein
MRRNARAPLSSGDILKLFITQIDSDFKLKEGSISEGRELRQWLKEHPVDFEQVVELMLAAVEILHSRLPPPPTSPDTPGG